MTPTPTGNPAVGSAEWLARKRELKEIVRPTKSISAVGTGKGKAPEKDPINELNQKYGISRRHALEVEDYTLKEVNTVYNRPADEYRLSSLRVSGLRDQSVADKIHNRVDEIVRAMGDPCYLPEIPGIVQLLEKYGPAESIVRCDNVSSSGGILSFDVYIMWIIGGNYYHAYEPFNFNLATGEELKMSDFFREGEDYIEIVNGLIKEADEEGNPFANDYWFYTDWEGEKSGAWSLYDDADEYDGGEVEREYQYTGAEPFYAGNTVDGRYHCTSVYGQQGKFDLLADWDPVHALKTDEEIYVTDEMIAAESIGYRYFEFSDMKYTGEVFDEYRRRYEKAESIHVPLADGTAEVRIIPAALTDEWSYYWYEELTKEEPQITAEETEAAIRQWVGQGFLKQRLEGFTFDKYAVIPSGYEVYPNGYGKVSIVILDGRSDFYSTVGSSDFWVKDGAFINDRDHFWDVSYEELFSELFSKFDGMTEENSVAAGKVIAPYVVSLTLEYGDLGFDSVSFTFGRGWGVVPDEAAPMVKELSAYLPQYLINDLKNAISGRSATYGFDRKTLFKHLRMYEGYPFE